MTAAILHYDSDKDVLVTTDLLLENVHFDLTYVPLKHLGYKSAIVNFSDVCAMNGTPRQITVSASAYRSASPWSILRSFTQASALHARYTAWTL